VWITLCDQFQVAVGETNGRPLGLACITKKLAFQRIEAMRGREKPVASGFRTTIPAVFEPTSMM